MTPCFRRIADRVVDEVDDQGQHDREADAAHRRELDEREDAEDVVDQDQREEREQQREERPEVLGCR